MCLTKSSTTMTMLSKLTVVHRNEVAGYLAQLGDGWKFLPFGGKTYNSWYAMHGSPLVFDNVSNISSFLNMLSGFLSIDQFISTIDNKGFNPELVSKIKQVSPIKEAILQNERALALQELILQREKKIELERSAMTEQTERQIIVDTSTTVSRLDFCGVPRLPDFILDLALTYNHKSISELRDFLKSELDGAIRSSSMYYTTGDPSEIERFMFSIDTYCPVYRELSKYTGKFCLEIQGWRFMIRIEYGPSITKFHHVMYIVNPGLPQEVHNVLMDIFPEKTSCEKTLALEKAMDERIARNHQAYLSSPWRIGSSPSIDVGDDICQFPESRYPVMSKFTGKTFVYKGRERKYRLEICASYLDKTKIITIKVHCYTLCHQL